MSEKLENRTRVSVNKNSGVFDAVVKMDRLECTFTADTLGELSRKIGVSIFLMEQDLEKEAQARGRETGDE